MGTIEVSVRTVATRSRDDSVFCVAVAPENGRCVLRVSGELDLASHSQLFHAAVAGTHPTMVVDMSELTFMDCSGYGSLVAARTTLDGTGRTLSIRNQNGQPAQVLTMIAALEANAGCAHQLQIVQP